MKIKIIIVMLVLLVTSIIAFVVEFPGQGDQSAAPAPAASSGAHSQPGSPLVAYTRDLPPVMSTTVQLIAVAPADQAALAQAALDDAAAALRDVDTRMSSHVEGTEIWRLNNAAVGELVAMTPPTLEVLRRARQFTPVTQGAFDVTCRPILQMWKAAGQRKAMPTPQEIEQAIENTGWRWFELTDAGMIRKREGASIDLGGIGKKFGIDRATEAMKRRGVAGGFVNVGGDIRCFGSRAESGPWHIAVRNPFSNNAKDTMAILAVPEGSVCTSGNYERFAEIDGRRYSHIVDPRTGWSCDNAPSVTVIGRDATAAGLWATALSVLGIDGLKLMPPDSGLEVLIVVGRSPESSRWYRTAGFDAYFVKKPQELPTPLTTPAPATKP